MEKTQNSLHMQKKKRKNKPDPCPMCGFDLQHNDKFSKRVALFDDDTNFIAAGWMCPKCECEFDLKDKLVYINKRNIWLKSGGKA